MTKEIRFSTSNLQYTNSDEDCYLDPSDPLFALQGQGTLGTLTPAAVNAAYDAHKRRQMQDEHFKLRDEAKRLGIRPGSPAWFALNQTRSR